MYVHSEVVVTQLEHRFPTAPSPETLPLQLLPSLGDTYNSQRTGRERSVPQQHTVRRARRTFFLAALVACPATFLLVRQVVSARSLILGRHCGVSWAYGTRTMEDRWWWWLLQGDMDTNSAVGCRGRLRRQTAYDESGERPPCPEASSSPPIQCLWS